MPQFHETLYGRRFFDGQLPALIKTLQGIEKNLGELVSKRKVRSQEDQSLINAIQMIEEAADLVDSADPQAREAILDFAASLKEDIR